MGTRDEPTDVGGYIRQRVIPSGMTVTAAAERLGVSRVALSNLLNGRASLSQQMAVRLKTAFGADLDELFRIQAEAESGRRREEERTIAVRTYVPPLLTIKASQIDGWADHTEEAERRLPVLVRRLIRSTGRDLLEVDFPAYGEGQRPGWDGRVNARAETPWIPAGRSGWELSTSKDPARKATSDLRNRLALPSEERAETTFVFVSSRNWPKKNQWAEKRKAEGHWKGVKALDASDLEQWLEESIEGQVWLAEQLQLPSIEECMTLDRAWERWAEVTQPRLSEAIFEPAVRAHRREFVFWLRRSAPGRPFAVAADSTDEAIAFLACLFRDEDVRAESGDRAVVVSAAQTLRTLVGATSSFIPIVSDERAEPELAHWQRHAIVVRPRNTVARKPDIELGLLGYKEFEKSLMAIGFTRAGVDRLARESGRSPTILRRRLSENDALRTPRWAGELEMARKVVPMALVGSWHVDSKADREVLSTLAGRPFREAEVDLAALRTWNDSPVWSAGKYRGVVSKIDALFAVARHMTPEDLDDFLLLSEYVLSEADPALELAPDRRWAAASYDKLRDHSDALRTGISETLVLLSVHGNDLFQTRLGIDLEAQVSDLVRRLLAPDGVEAPLTVETLMSYDRDLPRLAEAGPDAFLQLLERDLKRDDSALYELLKPAPPGPFADCPRTGLLWALECLAWSPRNLSRVVLILGHLSKTPIDDNWVNRPINSLKAIFRSWMPQTASCLDDRFRALELLCGRIPEVGWQICMEQCRGGPRTGDYSYRPRWRGDAADAGEPILVNNRLEFERKALELLLEWPEELDARRLGDLIDLLGGMACENEERVWALIEGWLEGRPEEAERAALRERLRRFGHASGHPARAVKLALRERAKDLHEQLAPQDPASRHAWLFAEHWLHEWPEGFDDAMDYAEREERITKRRAEAMGEIWSDQGLEGALSVLSSSNAAETVGAFVSRCVPARPARGQLVRACLKGHGFPGLELEKGKVDGFLRGFLGAEDEGSRMELLGSLLEELAREQVARLLLCAPFVSETWRFVERQDDYVRERYWREVIPHPLVGVSAQGLTELMDGLLEAGRPRAAFQAAHLCWDSVETSRLKRLLHGVVVGGRETDRTVQLRAYDICRAIESLSKRSGVTTNEMTDLELVFIEFLEYDDYGVPNLERRVAEDPSYFVWLVALVSKRNDGGEDSEGWPAPDPRNKVHLGRLAFSGLERIARIPGAKAGEGEPDVETLQRWVSEARRQGRLVGRADAVDDRIGQLLSQEVRDGSSSWPSRPVCQAMEAVATKALASGFLVGVRNSRGVVWRGVGGGQERELAGRYRSRAQSAAVSFPFVSQVLERIARSYEQDATYFDSEAVLRQRVEL